jgi:pimeloyl-ACP methyl ester carboxylesterase
MAETSSLKTTKTQQWFWRGYPICYQTQGDSGPAIVLVHGFGASSGHWRKNLPELATHCRVYAIDLLGFGGSAKPTPSNEISYTFETWGQQIGDFCREVVGTPAFLVGNSIGSIAAMQAAVDYPDMALGVALINCSLRMLHERRQQNISWGRRMGTQIMQKMLSVRWFGRWFYRQVAKPNSVRKILLQAYKRPEAVTDELVDLIMQPAREPEAADVFLAFTRYSQGPLPEDLLPKLSCPAIVIWGTDDPWEPVDMGRKLAAFDTVERFVPVEGMGHCPQDEAPELVNPILTEWMDSHRDRVYEDCQ